MPEIPRDTGFFKEQLQKDTRLNFGQKQKAIYQEHIQFEAQF